MSASDVKMAARRTKTKKQIPEKKLQAFSVGSMGKRGLSKKEQDDQRKKEEDEAAAHAFQEFVETFQETPNKTSKVWIKAGTYDAGARKEDTKDKGKLYKPTSRISEIHEKTSAEKAQEYARLLSTNDRKPDRLGKKKEKDKKKSNLELFKEELKMIQEEREERHKYKGVVKSSVSSAQALVDNQADKEANYLKDSASGQIGSFDNGDPTTTNLYLGFLNPKVTEQQLMELFGKYGPLASIKIMWPRSDEEKARGRNCGFVAFMNRQDGERALKNLNGRDVMNYEMKLGWGKAVPIPPHPIYIPPSLMELTMPPPPSGLPFNAQLSKKDREKTDMSTLKLNDSYMTDPEIKENVNKILYKAVIKVVMPTDRNLLMLIHRMVEFVIREGPMFEAMIMNREINNPMFRFLFENNSPAHVYYRWKLFSLLQGEQQKEWSTIEFRMFHGGSIWKPPPMNIYTQGMPDELVVEEEINEPNKGSLSATQRDRLEDLLRFVTPERTKIAKAMVFCLEHSDAADEICDCIAESLANDTTTIPKKLGRFFLVSDILANCAAKISNASFYRRAFESRLISMFCNLNLTYKNMESRLKAESFKSRVTLVIRAWEEWAIFPFDFLQKCHNSFLGIVSDDKEDQISHDEDVDGAPMSSGEAEEDLDGVPLDGAALLKGALLRGLPQLQSSPGIRHIRMDPNADDAGEDIDGVPMDNKLLIKSGGFVPSKWETVDPVKVEAQAITTSKWDTLEPPTHKSITPSPPLFSKSASNVSNDSEDESNWSSNDQSDIRDLNEERRLKLREIEVKSMQYQDELECGSKTLKSGWSIQQQVEHYRRKLIRKSDKEAREKDYDDKSPSPEREKKTKSERKSKRNDSSEKDRLSRHRSRSPHNSKKRSPSTSSRSNKRRQSTSPDIPSPSRKYHKGSSASPDRKYYTSSPGSSRKHNYNNLSPVRSKYGRVPTPSPPRTTSKYESPYRRSVSPPPPPPPPKSNRYNNSSSPPIHHRTSKHASSPAKSKHRIRSPTPKRHTRHSPSPTRSTSSKHSHSHRERDESTSRKHKHKYKH